MKFLGHPVHMMVVHFPTALIPMDFILNTIGYCWQDGSFDMAAFYCLVAGVTFGWIAVVFGAGDLLTINTQKEGALKAALVHGTINTIVLIGCSVIAWVQWKKYPLIETPSLSWLGVRATLVAVLLIGNYVGGNLVLKHKVGVHE